MAVYGYARVSSANQALTVQQDALRAAGCEVIRSEKRSGTTTEGRDELRTLIDFARQGDTVIVTRIDRLARSIADLSAIVGELQDKGIALRATEQPIDTGTAAGKAFLGMLGVFAEFETNIRKERQLEGIAKAKAEGRYKGKGRPASIPGAKIMELKGQGLGSSAIAKMLGISRMSVYRALSQYQSFNSRLLAGGTMSIKVTNDQGITFLARLVTDHKPWTGNNKPDDFEPIVKFYDTRYQNEKNEDGKFVSDYYVSTLLSDEEIKGLIMHGGVSDWKLTQDNMREVTEWLRNTH